MSDGVSTSGLEILSNRTELTHEEYETAYPIDTLLIATSPDSWSFQHFLDRVTCVCNNLLASDIQIKSGISSVKVRIFY